MTWPGVTEARPGRFIESTPLSETRKARPKEVNLLKVTLFIRDRNGMNMLVS